VSILSIFKKKHFFSAHEKKQIADAIHKAEKETCGRIALYIESKNYLLDPVARAKEVFAELKMKQSKQHNAVLIYIAVQHRELALYADEGIYTKVGKEFWENAVQTMISHFKGNNIVKGLENCIEEIGQTLKDKFPYDPEKGCDEFTDDIIYGK
jgi:uncharacterized membrane protein